jgi:SAM-dependent methyltransferase
MLANGYRNYRFGTRFHPSSWLGILMALVIPTFRATIEAQFRHIPRRGQGKRLLDIGCGNGEFLFLAKSAGWSVVGVDPDPNAVAVARSRGLDVRKGGIEVLGRQRDLFDGITLSHVIEHAHDPMALLRACHCLLKPGGWIWVETPNLDSLGHQRYARHWRGLEPPRHLVVFTRNSLCRLLAEAGFKHIQDQPFRRLCETTFSASEAIQNGQAPFSSPLLTQEVRIAARAADFKAKLDSNLREFITVKAWK